MVGHRAVVVLLLTLFLAVGVAGSWPETELPPLAALERSSPSVTDAATRASALVDTDTTPLERILRADAAAEAVARSPEGTPLTRAQYDALIRDLAADDIKGNAGAALHRLTVVEAAPLLEEALHSRDLQQRQLAAVALTRIPGSHSAELAAVLTESMHEAVEAELRATLASSSAVAATRYLYHHPENARPALRRALWSGDAQQRFLAAFLLGSDGSTEDRTLIVRELVGHLSDNDTSGDAMMAAHALYRLGSGVIPSLMAWRANADEQARHLMDLIRLDLELPPRSHDELVMRSQRRRITGIYHDPVIEFDVDRSHLATR